MFIKMAFLFLTFFRIFHGFDVNANPKEFLTFQERVEHTRVKCSSYRVGNIEYRLLSGRTTVYCQSPVSLFISFRGNGQILSFYYGKEKVRRNNPQLTLNDLRTINGKFFSFDMEYMVPMINLPFFRIYCIQEKGKCLCVILIDDACTRAGEHF